MIQEYPRSKGQQHHKVPTRWINCSFSGNPMINHHALQMVGFKGSTDLRHTQISLANSTCQSLHWRHSNPSVWFAAPTNQVCKPTALFWPKSIFNILYRFSGIPKHKTGCRNPKKTMSSPELLQFHRAPGISRRLVKCFSCGRVAEGLAWKMCRHWPAWPLMSMSCSIRPILICNMLQAHDSWPWCILKKLKIQ